MQVFKGYIMSIHHQVFMRLVELHHLIRVIRNTLNYLLLQIAKFTIG